MDDDPGRWDRAGTRVAGSAWIPALLLLSSLTAPSRASDHAITLVDVAEQAGVTLLNVSGGLSKDYIVEINGNGAAFFDYDGDGFGSAT